MSRPRATLAKQGINSFQLTISDNDDGETVAIKTVILKGDKGNGKVDMSPAADFFFGILNKINQALSGSDVVNEAFKDVEATRKSVEEALKDPEKKAAIMAAIKAMDTNKTFENVTGGDAMADANEDDTEIKGGIILDDTKKGTGNIILG